ncbi:MAG: glutamate synthase subunit alpha, partial [Proteobacteria bacterium]|nr:glutamate synthase subunit alpha [Pseudomonadota bacterium]
AITSTDSQANYIKALNKGIVKIMSKMGISTLQSYIGSQLFEAIGLSNKFVENYFQGTISRVGGIDFSEIAESAAIKLRTAYQRKEKSELLSLENKGHYFWRRNAESHLNNPLTVTKLQDAVRNNSFGSYQEYAKLINDNSKNQYTLRGLMKFKSPLAPIAIEKVEPASEIVKRFKTGAMSFGSISFEAHANLAIAMNRIGGKSNSGEGGEDSSRYLGEHDNVDKLKKLFSKSDWFSENYQDGDSVHSRIKQVASGRFGVTSEYLVNAEEIQIKIAQGAKPGEGGQLPGKKVDNWIASVRHSFPGITLISPPPHHDIYSIEDLSELIYDLKCANPAARISVKLVSEVGVGTIAAGVAKAKADVILISGADGGTGASPISSIKYAGLPWELGLSEAHQVLLLNGLRERVILETDGQLKTGRDVAIAAALGAEEFGFSTAPLIASGCVMMRKCHLNTCPVGIATQDPDLRKKFAGKPEHVINYMFFVAEELRGILAELGFTSLSELIGKADLLTTTEDVAQKLDLSAILYSPAVDFNSKVKTPQNHYLEKTLDAKLLMDYAGPALKNKEKVYQEIKIKNINRAVGTILGSEITKRYGSAGLSEDTVHFKFFGSAGQSLGAFIPSGLTLEVAGDANDYVGKGLSGGKIIVYPAASSDYVQHENVIIGNVAFYGATSGEGYISGKSGERFCVRNSGARVVVEGIGEHGCEYMTGGVVVNLGEVGKNFGAGMSGGVAYLYQRELNLNKLQINNKDLEISEIKPEDNELLHELLRKHVIYTNSNLAKSILWQWRRNLKNFVRVIPSEFREMMDNRNTKSAVGVK